MAEVIDDGFRSFGGIDDQSSGSVSDLAAVKVPEISAKEECVKALRESIIGAYERFSGPYGDRPIIYADWTASGKCVSKVESYLAQNVLPLYGNTHTTTSITGHQTTCFRHESRQIVAEAVNAKVTGRAAVDVVIFTGNGTTAAINKLVLSLGFNTPLPPGYDDNDRPIVFTSSYEHHSNLLTWRESVADVITVQYSPSTGVCLNDLSRLLTLHSKRKVKVGAFSAASNVTGVLTSCDSVSVLMHRAGGLVFFDYATAAPYVKMDMNPVCLGKDAPYVYKDAIIFSGHKFIGGPGCPGVLVVKRAVLPAQNSLPTEPGGGTVFYVTEEHHREEREEGGTPDILGDVKLGLVVSLKQSLGASWIESEELRISNYAQQILTSDPRIILLGRTGGWMTGDKMDLSQTSSQTPSQIQARHQTQNQIQNQSHNLPIFSFLIRRGHRFLHHNFVCALLNDLFGVQSRGGCQCAGPFSQHILGLSAESNKRIELALLDKHEVLRPGYSRFSLTYWMSKEDIDYILEAVLFVAEHGWKFLHLYRCNHKTGEWAHTTRLTRFPERKWLSHFSILNHDESQNNLNTNNDNNDNNDNDNAENDIEISTTDNDHISPSTIPLPLPLPLPASVAISLWHVRTPTELLNKIKKMALIEVDIIEGNHNPNGTNNKKQGKNNNKNKDKHGSVKARAMDGNDSVVLSAFEDSRWFVMANDIDNQRDDDDIKLPLKGPVQPPTEPFSNNIEPSEIVLEELSPTQQIEHLNKIVAALRSQLENKVENKVENNDITNSHESVNMKSSAEFSDLKQISEKNSENSLTSDLGSLYAQQRSQKLCIRSGGEGRQLPRYLTSLYGVPLSDSTSSNSNGNNNTNSSSNSTPKTTAAKITSATTIISTSVSIIPEEHSHKLNGVQPISTSIASTTSTSTHPVTSSNTLSATTSASDSSSSSGNVNEKNKKIISGTGVTYDPTQPSAMDISLQVKAMMPPKKIMKLVGQAVKEWNMIEEGDCLLLGLSGGKDSLALLHILLALQKRAPIKFSIACATVDPQTDSFDPSPLIPYVKALGVKYHYLSEPIVALAKTKLQGDSLCAFCSRFKRGLLYSCCRTNGYNKLVLAQHLDDLVESFLMSALHNGQVRTMKANYTIEAGDVRVIRPLVYVREKSTRDFSQDVHLPVINENCPACFEEPKERDRMKKLLVQEEAMIPALFYNLKRALLPLLDDSTYVTMQSVSAAAEARGRNGKDRLPSKKQDQVKLNEENKRKRSLESGQIGSGPGLFGQNSKLTNGKSETGTVSTEEVSIISSLKSTECTEMEHTENGNNVKNEIAAIVGEKSVIQSDSVEREDDAPEKKRSKIVVSTAVEGEEVEVEGDDSDDEIIDDENVCNSSYCPPCYELA